MFHQNSILKKNIVDKAFVLLSETKTKEQKITSLLSEELMLQKT